MCVAQTQLYSVFSKAQLLQRKGCKLQKKNRNFPNIVGLCLNMQKDVFFKFGVLLHVWFGVVGCVVFACFCVFVVE